MWLPLGQFGSTCCKIIEVIGFGIRWAIFSAKVHRPTHLQLWTWPLTKQWQQGRADLSAFRATLGFWGLQRSLAYVHGGFPKMGIPQMELFIMKHPIKVGWFGGTPILGTPLWSFCYWQPTQKNAEPLGNSNSSKAKKTGTKADRVLISLLSSGFVWK